MMTAMTHIGRVMPRAIFVDSGRELEAGKAMTEPVGVAACAADAMVCSEGELVGVAANAVVCNEGELVGVAADAVVCNDGELVGVAADTVVCSEDLKADGLVEVLGNS